MCNLCAKYSACWRSTWIQDVININRRALTPLNSTPPTTHIHNLLFLSLLFLLSRFRGPFLLLMHFFCVLFEELGAVEALDAAASFFFSQFLAFSVNLVPVMEVEVHRQCRRWVLGAYEEKKECSRRSLRGVVCLYFSGRCVCSL